PADPVGQPAEERDEDDRHDIGHHRHPQVRGGGHADAVGLLGGVGGPEDDHGRADHIGQPHAYGPHHGGAVLPEDLPHRGALLVALLGLLQEQLRFVHLGPDHQRRHDHHGAEQERN